MLPADCQTLDHASPRSETSPFAVTSQQINSPKQETLFCSCFIPCVSLCCPSYGTEASLSCSSAELNQMAPKHLHGILRRPPRGSRWRAYLASPGRHFLWSLSWVGCLLWLTRLLMLPSLWPNASSLSQSHPGLPSSAPCTAFRSCCCCWTCHQMAHYWRARSQSPRPASHSMNLQHGDLPQTRKRL